MVIWFFPGICWYCATSVHNQGMSVSGNVLRILVQEIFINNRFLQNYNSEKTRNWISLRWLRELCCLPNSIPKPSFSWGPFVFKICFQIAQNWDDHHHVNKYICLPYLFIVHAWHVSNSYHCYPYMIINIVMRRRTDEPVVSHWL